VPIPGWSAKDDVDPSTFGFWIDPQRILIQQWEPHGDAAPRCRIYELARRRWRATTACLKPDLQNPWRADNGPEGWLALYSSGEGVQSVLLARYSPAGQGEAPLAVAPQPSGAAYLSFGKDGALQLVSPCRLEDKQPSCPSADDAPWRLYSATTAGGPPVLQRSDLPPGAVPDPKGGRFAWPAGQAVCLGDPRQPPTVTCYPL
jgi:hypothetical protein